MTLVNCKISNYPLGEPDNQNPANNIALNSSVNNNTLPSHVKLVITPNNNTENPDGYYAVRAEDFHIGGLENYLNQVPDSYTGFFQGDDSTSGSFPSMVYPIEVANYFGDPDLSTDPDDGLLLVGDPAFTSYDGSQAPIFDQYTSDYSSSVWNSVSQEYFGLAYSPPLVERNQLSKDLFGNNIAAGSIPGRIYHYHGRNSNAYLNIYSDYSGSFPNTIGTGIFPSFNPGSNSFIDPSDGEYAFSGEEYLVQFIGTTFPANTDISLVNGDNIDYYNQQNKGIDKTTSWTYVNRIMICNSTPGLPSNLDDSDAYPIDNEVHVWVEFKNSYILNATPTDNPELWDIKVDVDGAAKFIET